MKIKVAVELMAGQISLHHGLTIHGSGPNSSDDRRIGVAIRYMSPHMTKTHGDKDYAIPARGNCDTGNLRAYPVPTSDFSPEALAVYDEIREVQTAVMMSGTKGEDGIGIYAKAK